MTNFPPISDFTGAQSQLAFQQAQAQFLAASSELEAAALSNKDTNRSSRALPSGSDFNTIIQGGRYAMVATGSANGPGFGGLVFIDVQREVTATTTTVHQTVYDTASAQKKERYGQGGDGAGAGTAWSAWATSGAAGPAGATGPGTAAHQVDFWRYSDSTNGSITSQSGAVHPSITIPAGTIVCRALFSNGTLFWFFIAGATYEFTGNYMAYGIDLTAVPPADGANVALVELPYDSANIVDLHSFSPIAYFWQGSNTKDSVVLDGKMLMFADSPTLSTQNPIPSELVTLFSPQLYSSIDRGYIDPSMTESISTNEVGWSGQVYKLIYSGGAGAYRWMFGNSVLFPDISKDLFISFDYKIIQGTAWSFAWWRAGVVGLPANAPLDATLQTRVILKVTAAQLANVADFINNYFDVTGGIAGDELWYGNVRVWQGSEYIFPVDDRELNESNSHALNSVVITPASAAAVFVDNLALRRATRICCAGSSITWGGGYLQTSMVENLINRRYQTDGVFPASVNSSNGVAMGSPNDRKLLKKSGVKITGAGATIDFTASGDEINIIQCIERSAAATDIEIYIDGVLHDTFSNANPTLGSGVSNFTGDGAIDLFDLGRAFTYSHAVTVAGIAKIGNLNLNQQYGGMSIPAGDDYIIVRKLGVDAGGNSEVHHYILFATPPANGAAIVVNYSYGEEICYEKTTIGKDAAGNLESPYGDGVVSYDPLNPSAYDSGLDFRETDSRCVRNYKFNSVATRAVQIRIVGLTAGAAGTPYFVFNAAVNRFHQIMNAGIGGWKSNLFITDTNLNNWQHIAAFSPDVLIYESAPNDDWITHGHKLSNNLTALTLAEMQTLKPYPTKSLTYNAGNATYDLVTRIGQIAAITERTVTLTTNAALTIDANPAPGDIVVMGSYRSRNDEQVSRIVTAYNAGTKTITFDRAIKPGDHIYPSLAAFVGQDCRVRDLSLYGNDTRTMVENIRGQVPDMRVGLIVNPEPNVSERELCGYPEYIAYLANKIKARPINMDSIGAWQNSLRREQTLTLAGSALALDSASGLFTYEFGTAGLYSQSFSVTVDGIEKYGIDCFVRVGRGWSVDQALTGAALDFASADSVRPAQLLAEQLQQRLEFAIAPAAGAVIVISWTDVVWSGDAAHIGDSGTGATGDLFGAMYMDALDDALAEDPNQDKLDWIDPATATMTDVVNALIARGMMRAA